MISSWIIQVDTKSKDKRLYKRHEEKKMHEEEEKAMQRLSAESEGTP